MQSLHPSRIRRALDLDGATLHDVLRERATAARVARRLGTTPARLIRALRRMTAGELAAVEGPAVEGPAVEGPAVEGPAVEGPAVEGPAVDVIDELPPEPAQLPDLAGLARAQLAARVERIKLWREIERLRERLDFLEAPAGPQG